MFFFNQPLPFGHCRGSTDQRQGQVYFSVSHCHSGTAAGLLTSGFFWGGRVSVSCDIARALKLATRFSHESTRNVFNCLHSRIRTRKFQFGVTHSNRELCGRIAEFGWLYRRVCEYINKSIERSGSAGLVEQVRAVFDELEN